MENQRIDIKVLTLLSLSCFLALGVLFNLCSSSITCFSTVSIEFSSFLCGVRHSASSEVLWLVISSNIFGTLPTDLVWYLLLVFGRGVIKELVCSSWAPDVDSEGPRSVWSWGTTLSSCSPSLSLKRALVLSMAYGGNPITIRLIQNYIKQNLTWWYSAVLRCNKISHSDMYTQWVQLHSKQFLTLSNSCDWESSRWAHTTYAVLGILR